MLFLLGNVVNAQKSIKGYIFEIDENKAKKEIPLASVYWQGTTIGVAADIKGNFEIIEPKQYPSNLIVSFIGYQSDTITLKSYRKTLNVKLKSSVGLNEFQITERRSGTTINTVDPLRVETLGTKELAKAACCNISESFETNASVDVNFTDAASGTKKIQMLGLDGIYTQIQYENLPLIRGLSAAYGLTFIPGTQAESIQIKKGAGSVVNGFESITGQINLELQKPD